MRHFRIHRDKHSLYILFDNGNLSSYVGFSLPHNKTVIIQWLPSLVTRFCVTPIERSVINKKTKDYYLHFDWLFFTFEILYNTYNWKTDNPLLCEAVSITEQYKNSIRYFLFDDRPEIAVVPPEIMEFAEKHIDDRTKTTTLENLIYLAGQKIHVKSPGKPLTSEEAAADSWITYDEFQSFLRNNPNGFIQEWRPIRESIK